MWKNELKIQIKRLFTTIASLCVQMECVDAQLDRSVPLKKMIIRSVLTEKQDVCQKKSNGLSEIFTMRAADCGSITQENTIVSAK